MASVVLHLPNEKNPLGPFYCNRDFAADQLGGATIEIETVAEHLNGLLNHPLQRLGDTWWWCAPPKIPYEYILVLVRPPESTSVNGDRTVESRHHAVYVVEMKPRQGMSVDMVRSYVYDVFGPNALSEDSLQCYKSTEDEQLFFSGSVLVANPPPLQQSPIKPDDNQPIIKPSEESPTSSFHSCRGSFGNQQSLILPAVLAVPQQLDEEQLPHRQNAPFICSCDGDDLDKIKTKTEPDVVPIVNIMPSEDQIDMADIISHNEVIETISTGKNTSGTVEQDLVLGRTPLKLLQQQKASLARNFKKKEVDNELDEEEYRSLHSEQFKFTEEEERRNIDKESASFPGACHRRIGGWNQVREQQLEVGFIYKQEEMDETDGASQNQAESESEMEELQHKVHVLEHIYNKECFLKDRCKNTPSSESFQEIERLTRAYEGGKLDHKLVEVLKRYIMVHCQRCSDPFCKVPHMAAGCPHPGVPSNLELSCSQSVSAQSQIHVPSDNFSGIPQNSQLQYLHQCHKFTDGKKIFMQATDNDTPSLCNRVYVGLGRPRMSEEQPTENCSCVNNDVVDPQVTDAELQSPEMIRNGYFPSVDICRCQLDSLIKRLVYCHEELSDSTGLTFGSAIADSLQVSQCIGKGGNGTVYNCSLQKHQLAAKLTHYRQRELCIWSGLKHENVIALLGVVLVPLRVYHSGVYVYQLMPLMTSSFRKEVDRVDNLHTLICTKKMPSPPILENVHHIFKEAMRGLGYLHNKLVYHGDIKGSNIFISKRPCCCCVSAILCECPAEFKCCVCIGDFDTAGYFTPSYDGDGVSDRIKTLHMGTPFYRSPEAHIGHMGPWCDMWSIGCLILYVTLGHSTTTALKKECGEINRDPAVVHQYNPLLVLLAENRNVSRLQHQMRDLCKVYPEFYPLSEFADSCLSLDFQTRITAEELVNVL